MNNTIYQADNLDFLISQPPNSVDFIYIDPPYNTGSKFIYNDARDNWVQFMRDRLLHCPKILKDEWIFCLHIDEKELFNAKSLMDEIFPGKFLNLMTWHNKYTTPNDLKQGVANQTEFILVYGIKRKFNNFPLRPEYVKKNFKYTDHNGTYRLGGQLFKKDSQPQWEVICPHTNYKYTNAWTHKGQSWNKLEEEGRIHWSKDQSKPPQKKIYLHESNGIVPGNMLTGEKVGWSGDGSKDLIALGFKKSAFDYPKPVKLMKYLLHIFTNPGHTVLDFFAGSGTTGQACIEMDNRKFVLCTNNENNICQDVTIPRIKKLDPNVSVHILK